MSRSTSQYVTRTSASPKAAPVEAKRLLTIGDLSSGALRAFGLEAGRAAAVAAAKAGLDVTGVNAKGEKIVRTPDGKLKAVGLGSTQR